MIRNKRCKKTGEGEIHVIVRILYSRGERTIRETASFYVKDEEKNKFSSRFIPLNLFWKRREREERELDRDN